MGALSLVLRTKVGVGGDIEGTASITISRGNPAVLWIFYEDLLESDGFALSVRRIAGNQNFECVSVSDNQ